MDQLLMLKQRQCGENKWKITISNVKYDKGNIAKWQVKYKLVEDEHWNTTEDYEFFVYKSGTYIIKLVNNDVESEKKQIKLVIEEENYISKTEPYVGYYADIEGDGIVDGVIYADLAIGKTKTGQLAGTEEKYDIPIEKDVKDYTISQKNYEGKFGTKDVIKPVEGNIGKDRFYVMALEDKVGDPKYTWYNSAKGKMQDYITTTAIDFGKGKRNTNIMIDKWNLNAYGEKNKDPNYKDVWGAITTEVKKGWFVPSKNEWIAFAGELEITKENYASKKLEGCYWTSSQYGAEHAWTAYFNIGKMGGFFVDSTLVFLRLSRIF